MLALITLKSNGVDSTLSGETQLQTDQLKLLPSDVIVPSCVCVCVARLLAATWFDLSVCLPYEYIV